LDSRSIKVTLLPENLFYFPLDISPNCFQLKNAIGVLAAAHKSATLAKYIFVRPSLYFAIIETFSQYSITNVSFLS
jgi:hypothetical protein